MTRMCGVTVFFFHILARWYSETVLLVYDCEAEIAEHHIVLNHSMSADEYMQRAILKLRWITARCDAGVDPVSIFTLMPIEPPINLMVS